MIGPRTFSAVGLYVLTNVATSRHSALLLQTRLMSGGGVTWALRKRVTGSSVADAAAPRAAFTDFSSDAAISNATAITATTAPQLHTVPADGCDILLEILSVTGAGVLQVDMQAITGGP